MTCVLIHQDRVYADSAYVKGGETFYSLTKIRGFPCTVPVIAKCASGEIDDELFGYVSAGAHTPAVTFVHRILEEGPIENKKLDISETLEEYAMIANSGLINDYNYFEVIFIGARYHHSFNLTPGELRYRRYGKDETIVMGTGGPPTLYFLKESKDPIQSIYRTFQIDPVSGGMIDVWELRTFDIDPETIGREFRRVGICQDVDQRDVAEYLRKTNARFPGMKWVPDFLSVSITAEGMDKIAEKRARGILEEQAAKRREKRRARKETPAEAPVSSVKSTALADKMNAAIENSHKKRTTHPKQVLSSGESK